MGFRRDGGMKQPSWHRLQVVAPIQATGELSEIAGTVFFNAKAWTMPESAVFKGAPLNPNFRDEVLGARRTAAGMYALVHEDCEHRATKQFARKTDL